MIDIEAIKKEIKELEECSKTSYDVCNKLAVLYTVKNNYAGDKNNNTNNSIETTTTTKI